MATGKSSVSEEGTVRISTKNDGFSTKTEFCPGFSAQIDEVCSNNDGFCSHNDGFCSNNDGFCSNNDGFCSHNDGFCSHNGGFCNR